MKLSPIVISLFCQYVTNAMTTSIPKQYFIGFDLGYVRKYLPWCTHSCSLIRAYPYTCIQPRFLKNIRSSYLSDWKVKCILHRITLRLRPLLILRWSFFMEWCNPHTFAKYPALYTCICQVYLRIRHIRLLSPRRFRHWRTSPRNTCQNVQLWYIPSNWNWNWKRNQSTNRPQYINVAQSDCTNSTMDSSVRAQKSRCTGKHQRSI